MDLGMFGHISFDLAFLSSLFSIVIIDLILAGDNAVVIAMAVRSLPQEQRKKGIIFGAAAAVLLRVILTFFVAQLLRLSYVKLAGGILILWIAVKLFVEGAPEDEQDRHAVTIWQAIKIIVIADITMSLDNMLAVGGASHGNMFLLLFGLGLSIPFIVLTSNLLSMLMDKYPVIIYIGAAILGKVGGEMIITDPFTVTLLPASLLAGDLTAPVRTLQYGTEAVFAAGVLVAGKLWMRWGMRQEKETMGMAEQVRTVGQKRSAILTISREFGSGGREIGQAVARDLGYEYVDREKILPDIRKAGEPVGGVGQDARRALPDRVGEVRLVLSRLRGAHAVAYPGIRCERRGRSDRPGREFPSEGCAACIPDPGSSPDQSADRADHTARGRGPRNGTLALREDGQRTRLLSAFCLRKTLGRSAGVRRRFRSRQPDDRGDRTENRRRPPGTRSAGL